MGALVKLLCREEMASSMRPCASRSAAVSVAFAAKANTQVRSRAKTLRCGRIL